MERPNRFAGGHFRHADDQWSVSVADNAVDVAAAWLQFKLARQIWQLTTRKRLNLEALADQLGQSVEAQRKKLSGEQPASLRDLVGWIMTTGNMAYDALPREDADLFPIAARRIMGRWRSGNGTIPQFHTLFEPDWPRLTTQLSFDVTSAYDSGQSHLLSAHWMQHQAIAHITDSGIAPHELRLLATDNAVGLQWGVLHTQTIMFDFLSSDECSDTTRSTHAAWRLRMLAKALAVSGKPGTILAATLSPLGAAVLREALRVPPENAEFAIGPFEEDRSFQDTDWWSAHCVQMRHTAQVQLANSGVISAIQILKLTSI